MDSCDKRFHYAQVCRVPSATWWYSYPPPTTTRWSWSTHSNTSPKRVSRLPTSTNPPALLILKAKWKDFKASDYKVLFIVFKAQLGVVPKYLCDQHPTSSYCLILSSSLIVPWTRATLAKSRSLSIIGPSFWNRLKPSAHASYPPIFLHPYLFLKLVSFFISNRTKSAFRAYSCWGGYINAQYNVVSVPFPLYPTNKWYHRLQCKV